jgi:hypothetical protein
MAEDGATADGATADGATAEDGAAIEMELELDSLFDTETVQVVSKVNAKALHATLVHIRREADRQKGDADDLRDAVRQLREENDALKGRLERLEVGLGKACCRSVKIKACFKARRSGQKHSCRGGGPASEAGPSSRTSPSCGVHLSCRVHDPAAGACPCCWGS